MLCSNFYMKIKIFVIYSFFFSLCSASGRSLAQVELEVSAFETDGCSYSIDGPPNFDGILEWRHCCVAHDIDYWLGGRGYKRKIADKELKSCVNKSVGRSEKVTFFSYGSLMYLVVRVAGTSHFVFINSPANYRWGFGLSKNIRYEDLSADISVDAIAHLEDYLIELENIRISGPEKLTPSQVAFLKNKVRDKVLEIKYYKF